MTLTRPSLLYPEVGSYIAFAINLQRTAVLWGVGDSESLDPSPAVPGGSTGPVHIGLVESRSSLDNNDSSASSLVKLTIRLALSSQFLESSASSCNPWNIMPSMSVAVAPNSAHPFGRVVHPDPPLPWDNLYHSSFVSIVVNCLPNLDPVVSEPLCHLNEMQRSRLRLFGQEDNSHLDALNSQRRPISGVYRALRQSSDQIIYGGPNRHDMRDLRQPGMPYDQLLHYQAAIPLAVDFSYDLSTATVISGILPDPGHFFKVAEIFNRFIPYNVKDSEESIEDSASDESIASPKSISSFGSNPLSRNNARMWDDDDDDQPQVNTIQWRSHPNRLKVAVDTISQGVKRVLGWMPFKPMSKGHPGIMHIHESTKMAENQFNTAQLSPSDPPNGPVAHYLDLERFL